MYRGDSNERNLRVEQTGETHVCAEATYIDLVGEDVPRGTRTGSEEAVDPLRELADKLRRTLDTDDSADHGSSKRTIVVHGYAEVIDATTHRETRSICGEYQLSF
jgi:hypothetical protein